MTLLTTHYLLRCGESSREGTFSSHKVAAERSRVGTKSRVASKNSIITLILFLSFFESGLGLLR